MSSPTGISCTRRRKKVLKTYHPSLSSYKSLQVVGPWARCLEHRHYEYFQTWLCQELDFVLNSNLKDIQILPSKKRLKSKCIKYRTINNAYVKNAYNFLNCASVRDFTSSSFFPFLNIFKHPYFLLYLTIFSHLNKQWS